MVHKQCLLREWMYGQLTPYLFSY